MNHGKLVLIGILLVALIAASFSWWFQFQQGDEALAFWGGETARTIRLEKPVLARRIVRSTDDAPAGDILTVDGVPYRIQATRDITNARGLVHARQALIQNQSFDWTVAEVINEPDWTFALRFGQANKVTLLIDLTNHRIRRQNHPHCVGLKITEGLQEFLHEQFDQ